MLRPFDLLFFAVPRCSIIPGLPAPLPSITGGPATSTSGDTGAQRGGTVGGISSPIVIGGFKTSGEASGGVLPAWVIYGGAFLAVVAVGAFLWKKFK